jgi:hypothetical protein
VDIKSRVGRAGSACSREAGREMKKGIDIKWGVFVELCVETNDRLCSSFKLQRPSRTNGRCWCIVAP